jgi:chromosome partitioning protein
MLFVPVINQKGGVGKTTITSNLGAELTRLDLKVLLIDNDPQGTLTEATVGPVEAGTAEILGYGPALNAPLSDTFDQAVRHSESFGVDVLGANYEHLFAHQDVMKSQSDLQLRFLDLLGVLDKRYDIVLVDCPPNLGTLTLAAIYASTGILIVVETAEEATKGLGILTKAIQVAHRMTKVEFAIVGAVLTKYRAGELMADDTKTGLEATNLFPWVLPVSHTVQFKLAFSEKLPLRSMMKEPVHRRAVREIAAIADRLAALIPQKASA